MGRLSEGSTTEGAVGGGPAFVFDLDGTLVDSVYQHVLAWREALEEAGITLAGGRIHRRVGVSGGVFVNCPPRETGRPGTAQGTAPPPPPPADPHAPPGSPVRAPPGGRDL